MPALGFELPTVGHGPLSVRPWGSSCGAWIQQSINQTGSLWRLLLINNRSTHGGHCGEGHRGRGPSHSSSLQRGIGEGGGGRGQGAGKPCG